MLKGAASGKNQPFPVDQPVNKSSSEISSYECIMLRKIPTACLLLFLFLIIPSGCGRGDGFIRITGTVTLDGEPLMDGSMSFASVDGMTAGAGCPITDGRFEALVPPGRKRVAIQAMKNIGSKKRDEVDGGGTVPVFAPLLKVPKLVEGELTNSYEMEVKPKNGAFHIDLKSEELLGQ